MTGNEFISVNGYNSYNLVRQKRALIFGLDAPYDVADFSGTEVIEIRLRNHTYILTNQPVDVGCEAFAL